MKQTKAKEVRKIEFIYTIIGLVIGLIIAFISSLIFFRKGIEHRKRVAEAEFESAEKESQRIVSEAEKVAERRKRDALIEAREEIHKSRVEIEREVRERRTEIQRTERRLQQKDETLEKKMDTLEKKEESLNKQIHEIEARQADIEELHKKQIEKLESISGLSVDEAKQYLLNNIEGEVKHEAAIMVKDIYERAKEEATANGRKFDPSSIKSGITIYQVQGTGAMIASK
jgi:ribonuclease Y